MELFALQHHRVVTAGVLEVPSQMDPLRIEGFLFRDEGIGALSVFSNRNNLATSSLLPELFPGMLKATAIGCHVRCRWTSGHTA